jgi:hypothetical protein
VSVVTSVFAVLGIGLTAASLYGADRSQGTARTLALAGAGIAAACVVVAVGILLARLAEATGSRGRARRPARRPPAGLLATVPGALLAISLGLLGAAAAVTVVGPAESTVPRLTVSTVRADDGSRVVQVDVTVGGLDEGAPIAVSLSAVTDGTTVLSSVVRRASGGGGDTVRLGGTVVEGRSVQVDVSLTGRLCRAVVPVRSAVAAEDAVVTCRSR